MSPEEKLCLTHIAEAAALIGRDVEGISKREFLEDTLRQDAVIRRIQIIEEGKGGEGNAQHSGSRL